MADMGDDPKQGTFFDRRPPRGKLLERSLADVGVADPKTTAKLLERNGLSVVPTKTPRDVIRPRSVAREPEKVIVESQIETAVPASASSTDLDGAALRWGALSVLPFSYRTRKIGVQPWRPSGAFLLGIARFGLTCAFIFTPSSDLADAPATEGKRIETGAIKISPRTTPMRQPVKPRRPPVNDDFWSAARREIESWF